MNFPIYSNENQSELLWEKVHSMGINGQPLDQSTPAPTVSNTNEPCTQARFRAVSHAS